MIRTLVVDDETLARERLKLLLEQEPSIAIVGECRDGHDALSFLQSHPVDLLFLDIQMPSMSGFDLVEQLGLIGLPPTVFVTAYQEHAIRAFEVQAIDYLTKPIHPHRLRLAVERVQQRILAQQALLTHTQFSALLSTLQTPSPSAYTQRLLVRDGFREILVSTEDIMWIEAADYYSSLHVGKRTLLLRESLTDLSRRLDPELFLRLHRSAIVNLKYVREIFREGRGVGTVVLTDGSRIRLSRAGKRLLMEGR